MSYDELQPPDLSDYALSEKEEQELREGLRKEEEAYWAKHGRPPQWRKKTLALISEEYGVAPGERYSAQGTERERRELAAKNPDAAVLKQRTRLLRIHSVGDFCIRGPNSWPTRGRGA